MSEETKIDDGGPAFPGFAYTSGDGPCKRNAQGEWEQYVSGMSLRDWYAGQAMVGIMAGTMANPNGMMNLTTCVQMALGAADIAIEQRDLKP